VPEQKKTQHDNIKHYSLYIGHEDESIHFSRKREKVKENKVDIDTRTKQML
jgi:hypothetical protein